MIDLTTGVLVAAFANNAALSRGLGVEHLDSEVSIRRALALTVLLACVTLPATGLAWLLARPSIGVDRSIALFVLIIACAALTATLQGMLQRLTPRIADLTAVDGRLLLLDSMVLAPAIANLHASATLAGGIATSLAAVSAFGLVLILLVAMRDRLRCADIPAALRGTPIELITVALMSLAWLGLAGIGQHA